MGKGLARVEWRAGDTVAGYSPRMPADFERPSWEADKYPGRHVARVGTQAGAQELAANVYELDPGCVGSPLHAHHANEELLLVLAGTLSLRGADGTQLLPGRRRGGVSSGQGRRP
jgi:uncharacterized cupin superfamily protein